MTQTMEKKHNEVKSGTEAAADAMPEREQIAVPAADVREDKDHIRLLVDMPGAAPGDVEVTVENNVLSIAARAHVEVPAGYQLVGREYGASRYRRDFTLADTVDANGIKARVSQGVLELTLPKREEVKKRSITIAS